MVILSLSLGVLYQAAIGATRNVAVSEEYTDAVILAESMMSRFSIVTSTGVQGSGQFAEYSWQVTAIEIPVEAPTAELAQLVELEAIVEWEASKSPRSVRLVTAVPLVPASDR